MEEYERDEGRKRRICNQEIRSPLIRMRRVNFGLENGKISEEIRKQTRSYAKKIRFSDIGEKI